MRVIIILAWLVGAPIASYFVANSVEEHYNTQLRAVVAKEAAASEQQNIYSKITLSEVCAQPEIRNDMSGACEDSDRLGAMKSTSIWISGLALILIAGIKFAGIISRKNRLVLLWLFSPGLYLTIFATSILVLANAALLIGAIWYGETVFIGRIHVGVIVALGAGALVGVGAMLKASFAVFERVSSRELGKNASQKEAPQLWRYVKEIAKKVGATPPQNIIVGFNPNFYVTESSVKCLDGTLEGRSLYLSLPLCRILTKDELSAVIAHEMGHFIGQDTKFSLRFYPIYRSASDALMNLEPEVLAAQGKGGSGAMMFAIMPVRVILGYFLEAFSVAESTIGRTRELQADKVGVKVANATTVATALVKIHAFAPYWRGVEDYMRKLISKGEVLVNASSFFGEYLRDNSKTGDFDGLDEVKISHPTDSHPPLSVRLAALGTTLAEVAKVAIQVQPGAAAISLIDRYEEIEKVLSDVTQELIMKTGEAMLPADLGLEVAQSETEELPSETAGEATAKTIFFLKKDFKWYLLGLFGVALFAFVRGTKLSEAILIPVWLAIFWGLYFLLALMALSFYGVAHGLPQMRYKLARIASYVLALICGVMMVYMGM